MDTKQINIELVKLEIAAKRKAASLIPQIIDVVKKFDGKQPSKRLDTALKKVDPNLHFETRYNSFMISMYIANRSFNTEHHSHYIKEHILSIIHSSIRSSYGDGICQDGVINSSTLVSILENQQRELIKYADQAEKELENLDNIFQKKIEIDKLISEFQSNTSYLIQRYFSLRFN